MLYYPWFDEQADLLGANMQPMRSTIDRCQIPCVQTNEGKYTKADIDDIEVDDRWPT